MPRYVAFLRGVSPMNAKMADLRACIEKIGYTDVKTVLSSGNVIFTTTKKSESNLAKAIESGMAKDLPRSFPVIVRTTMCHMIAARSLIQRGTFRRRQHMGTCSIERCCSRCLAPDL